MLHDDDALLAACLTATRSCVNVLARLSWPYVCACGSLAGKAGHWQGELQRHEVLLLPSH